jgi:vacuolar-type H+-ATPase subunit C/Vma6
MTKNIQTEYEKDFYAWAIHNAKLLREGKLSEVDIENIAEEIESMGKSEKRELINRLAVLLAHLLKWEFQPERRGNSWRYTIKEQRLRLQDLLKESPSLKKSLEENLNHAYEHALIIAIGETDCSEKTFPKKCPFSLQQALDKDFFPG